MSSILKALKKIEGRKVDKSRPAWPFGTGSLETMDSHIHRSRRSQKILGILILLCVAALAGKLYIGSRSDSGKTGAENTVSRSAPSSTGGEPGNPADTAGSGVQTSVGTVTRTTPASKPTTREASPGTTPSSANSPPPVEEAPSEAAAPLVITPPPVEPRQTAAGEETTSTPATENFGTPPTDNAGLSLMALTWSARPESRFVVINGTIVREGGSIADSTVVRIESDYVVMRTGGVTWKLK